MRHSIWTIGLILVVALLFLGVGLAFMRSPTQAVAAQADDGSLRTIQVSGRGQVSATPDRAVVRLGVQTEAETAQDALNENNDRMGAVISATATAGIDESDIQTQGFRLEPVYESPSGEGQPELVGYRASNIVRITVRGVANLGELLDMAVAAGGNTIEGIRFEVSNEGELEAAAREAAMQNAQQKAEQLTELAGATLGPVQTILETGFSRPVSIESEASLAAAVPIQPGSQAIEASVQVTWEIR